MINFIKHKFRALLEGTRRDGKDTSANSFGGKRKFELTTEAQYNRAAAEIEKAKAEYYPIKMGDLYEGDGLYEMKLHTNGYMMVKQSHITDKKSPGTFQDNNTKTVRYFYAMANRGISHADVRSDDYSELEDTGKQHSPAEQAALKIKVLFKYEILDFLKMNMSGESEYTADPEGAKQQVADKGDQYTQMKQSDKLKRNLEVEKQKGTIRISDYIKKLSEIQQTLSTEKRDIHKLMRNAEGSSKEQIKMISKSISNDLHNVNNELKMIERVGNLLKNNQMDTIHKEIGEKGMEHLYRILPSLQ